jgi:biotin/lipoyl attachment
MAKKVIDVMDTTFRDGFQSVFGARVLMDDFLPAVEAARHADIRHFEFGGGARFQSLYFYTNEDAFLMMDKFREKAGADANLQTLARGINTVTLDTGSREIIDLHAKLFAKHNTNTIRNFDALNDVENLRFSGECIKKYGLKHEITITMMDLPPKCHGAHDSKFYEMILKRILKEEIPFDSVCFKDASGTSSPQKVYETIKMAKKLLPEGTHVRLHTHETAGVSVACYLAALEAGVDGIDLAAHPVSGGTSQPDILTLLHATKGKDYDLGLDINKILEYEDVLQDCLKEYFLPPEATRVSPIIPFSPMPGGALTANTQMMRDNNILSKFPEVIKAMQEVVECGGFGTSVTPVSQFYFQQAFNNVIFGKWQKIAEGYGRMVLGYFGKTPVKPDEKIIELASKQLNLAPTTQSAIDIADADKTKSIEFAKDTLKQNGIETTEENIFIFLACKEKGLVFLKGNGKVMVRKNQLSNENNYNVVINGNKYAVCVDEYKNGYNVLVNGNRFSVSLEKAKSMAKDCETQASKGVSASGNEDEIVADVPGNVFKVLIKPGDSVKKGQQIIVLEAMKMEIPVESPKTGIIGDVLIETGKSVEAGEVLAKFK